jgi:hypothetical protein
MRCFGDALAFADVKRAAQDNEFVPRELHAACVALQRGFPANVAVGSFSTDPASFACRSMSASPGDFN